MNLLRIDDVVWFNPDGEIPIVKGSESIPPRQGVYSTLIMSSWV